MPPRAIAPETVRPRPHDGASAAPRKILAIASAGGHWTQLMRLRTAFAGADVVFVSTRDMASANRDSRFLLVPDANRFEKMSMLRLIARMGRIVLRERPDVVISTGAAPGFIGLAFGRLVGARTIWVDSLANVDRLSLSGKLARPVADLWLTQWAHLAADRGPSYRGSVV